MGGVPSKPADLTGGGKKLYTGSVDPVILWALSLVQVDRGLSALRLSRVCPHSV